VDVLNRQVHQSLKRMARLTNAHWKSLKHRTAMTAIFVTWYNFCRVRSSIGKTPAMASGLSDHAWTVKELIERGAA
jgi:hypothetical protein